MRLRRAMGIVCLTAALVASACSADDDGTASEAGSGTTVTTAPATPTTSAVDRPDGPAADLSEALTGGGGVMLAAASAGPDLGAAGFVESEHVAAGTAVAYTSEGELPTDGRFELVETGSADYRTRVVVRRPEAAEDFNGTVVVEWLNVSGGFDANPDWSFMADELLRGGYAWVGVSAQAIGVEGGPVAVGVAAGGDLAGKGLKAIDPERYGSLEHPGDAYAYDIYTQVGRALRADDGVLGDLVPERIVAVGESQSAFALTTYVDGVQPLTGAFDGFIIHSRGGAAAPLGEGGGPIDIASAIAGPPTIVRTDTEVPVLIIESETDLTSILAYYPARQDDTDRIRLWEMAGTAHADQFLVGPVADSIDCGVAINDGPQHLVLKAAVRAMDTWVRTGEAPPEAPRLEIEVVDGTPTITRDADGIALGGIRTPHVDVPVDALTGEPGPEPSVICLLLGSTIPLPDDRLVELHGTADDYLAAFAAAGDAAIEAGFVLEDDRDAMLAEAQPDRIPG